MPAALQRNGRVPFHCGCPMKRLTEAGPVSSRICSMLRPISASLALVVPLAGFILWWDAAGHAIPAASRVLAEAALPPGTSTSLRRPNASGKAVELSAVARIGREMFFDPSLSDSGQLACASCHRPDHAYGPANGLAVQIGGRGMGNSGVRAVPSLEYLEHTPNFTIGPNSAVPETDAPPPAAVAPPVSTEVATVPKADKNSAALIAAEANVPQGGLDWDGRADTIQSQATGPLLDPNEMANRNLGEVLARLKKASYAEDLKKLFGAHIFDEPDLAVNEAMFALARFQIEDPSFHPYDSKYDAYLRGKATLSKAEMRGLKLFEDPHKGNCSSCHIDKASRDGLFPPAFTDYQFEALGAPRNRAIPANRDPHYYDLGLCGPYRKDYAQAAAYCGLFKTPTLRNVATRKAFFHNGVFHSLKEVLDFYVERATEPGKSYPKLPNGKIDLYDDLPPQYKRNIDVVDAPFDGKRGDKPALDNEEIADVIAFLKTLTDGYRPDQNPAGANQSKR